MNKIFIFDRSLPTTAQTCYPLKELEMSFYFCFVFMLINMSQRAEQEKCTKQGILVKWLQWLYILLFLFADSPVSTLVSKINNKTAVLCWSLSILHPSFDSTLFLPSLWFCVHQNLFKGQLLSCGSLFSPNHPILWWETRTLFLKLKKWLYLWGNTHTQIWG